MGRDFFRWPKPGRWRGLLAAALVLGGISTLRADEDSRNAIRASPTQMGALGLLVGGNPFTPTGAGVRIGVAEAANGLPELNPTNPWMPAATGTATGQNNRINITLGTGPANDHATTVSGVIMQSTYGVAEQAGIIAGGKSSFNDLITVSQTMLNQVANGGRNASILNWSWHGFNPPGAGGTATWTQWADWAALTASTPPFPFSDKLIVVAGNETAAGTRFNPWDNFNGITVGATGGAAYRTLANYNDVAGTYNRTTDVSPYGANSTRAGGRYKTDILAPGGGDNHLLAAPVLLGGAQDNFAGGTPNNGLNSDPNWGGTSFAAPHVSGAAALLTEFGVARGFSADHRVLKAVLLNGASKTGVTEAAGAWAAVGNVGNKVGGAGPTNTIRIGWDDNLGTGLLDVSESLLIYNGGQQGPGNITDYGWDLRGFTNNPGAFHQYRYGQAQRVTATLAWDRVMALVDGNANTIWDAGETFNALTLNDLDLVLWDLTLNALVPNAFSTSDMDSIEHIDFAIPEADWQHDFALRVYFANNFTPGFFNFGLAWHFTPIPEPATVLLILGTAGSGGWWWRRRRQAHAQAIGEARRAYDEA